MRRNKKPRVLVHCVANAYAGEGERIIEFSDTVAGEYAGGLISFRRMADGLRVEVYREERCAVWAPVAADLLAALKDLAASCQKWAPNIDRSRARAAIAKAKGLV